MLSAPRSTHSKNSLNVMVLVVMYRIPWTTSVAIRPATRLMLNIIVTTTRTTIGIMKNHGLPFSFETGISSLVLLDISSSVSPPELTRSYAFFIFPILGIIPSAKSRQHMMAAIG